MSSRVFNGMKKPVYGEIFQTVPCYEYVEGEAVMPVPRVIKFNFSSFTAESEKGINPVNS